MFRPNKVENRTHSKGYVKDFPPKCGQKRWVKMEVLNLSVFPL
ncbi:secretion protein HlyD [Selenomonas dianae]|nr:secretion protein HlyD [Selenomonas dianae]WLD83529.1 secretion protein HlyD [Selenomonas dianae]